MRLATTSSLVPLILSREIIIGYTRLLRPVAGTRPYKSQKYVSPARARARTRRLLPVGRVCWLFHLRAAINIRPLIVARAHVQI